MKSGRSQEVAVPKPVLTITAMIGALIFPALLLGWDIECAWTPLEREYLLTYLASVGGGSSHARLLIVN